MRFLLFPLQILILGLGGGLPLWGQVGSDELVWTAFVPQGASARAVGIGGAFTAVADDATAVSFNPAGLAQLLKPEFTYVGMWGERSFGMRGQLHFPGEPDLPYEERLQVRRQREPLFTSMTFPWKVKGRNVVFQVSTQRLYELEGHSTIHRRIGNPIAPLVEERGLSDQRGSINMRSLALAAELSPRLLFGVALNAWKGDWTYTEQDCAVVGADPTQVLTWEKSSVRGTNWTLGAFWRFNLASFSVVYRTPFDADFSQILRKEINAQTPEARHEGVVVRWPESLALGLAFRPHPDWLVAGDWVRSEWSKARVKDPGGPMDGVNFFDGRSPTRVVDAASARLGVEYLVSLSGGLLVPLRAGTFREPSFSVDPGTGQQRVIKGWTLGCGIRFKQAWVDLAYKDSRGSRTLMRAVAETPTHPLVLEGQETIRERRLFVSFTVQFSPEVSRKALRWFFVGD